MQSHRDAKSITLPTGKLFNARTVYKIYYIQYYHIIIYLQSVPEGMPKLLKPDFAKLDGRKLLADISKYPKAAVPRDKMNFWEKIEEHLQRIQEKSEARPSQWPLTTLQTRRQGLQL